MWLQPVVESSVLTGVSATPAYPSAMILVESLTQFSFYCWSETTSSLTVTQSEKRFFSRKIIKNEAERLIRKLISTSCFEKRKSVEINHTD